MKTLDLRPRDGVMPKRRRRLTDGCSRPPHDRRASIDLPAPPRRRATIGHRAGAAADPRRWADRRTAGVAFDAIIRLSFQSDTASQGRALGRSRAVARVLAMDEQTE